MNRFKAASRFAAPPVAALAFVALAAAAPSHEAMDFLVRLAALAIFATSLNLLAGYGGMVSFGHGLYYGFGAYSFALIMQQMRLPVPVALLATVVAAGVAAAVVGAVCVRLREVYFSFVTLAFQMLFHAIILAAASLTGGDQGLRGGVPRPPFFGIDLANQRHLCVFAAALLVLCLLAMHRVVVSPLGATLRMTRDNPDRAAFLGVSVGLARLKVFVLAAMFASIAGAVQALFVSGAYPEFADWTVSGEGIFVLMLGGTATFLGPTAGAALMLLLNDAVTRFTDYHGLVLGSVILAMALGFRKGVADVIMERLSSRFAGRWSAT